MMTVVLSVTSPANAAYENTHVNTGNQRADIIAVAVTQLGYTEEAGGYSKYGDYHGNPYADWCGYFVSWCARQANVPTSVLPKQGFAAASSWGLTTFTSSQKTPQPGDLYFNGTAHCGLVYYVSGSSFYTLEGNSVGDKVISRALSLSSYTFASPNYGGSNNVNHTHNLQYKSDTAHPHKEYQKCTGCDYVNYTGFTHYVETCTECIQENCSHTYSSWASTGSSKHQRTCSKCNKLESLSHDWQDVKVIKEATCKESGSKTQSCPTCSATQTVTVNKTDSHDYDEWKYYTSQYHIRTCSVCNRNDTKNHVVDEEEWGTDEEKHWHECADCGEKYDEAEHSYEGQCVEPCGDCGYVRPEGHNYGKEWLSNSNEHWQVCEDCEETTLGKKHEFDSDCDPDCDVCQYSRETEHKYSETLMSDEEGHWYPCESCGDKKDFTPHNPGPEASEEAAQLCTECTYEIMPMVIHEHVIDYSSDDNTHWGSCQCGYEVGPERHAWDMATSHCSVCFALSVQETETQNWDFVWMIIAGVVVIAITVTIVVIVNGSKKRKANRM